MNEQVPAEGAAISAPPWMSRLGLNAIGWVRLLLLGIIGALTLVATAVGILDIVKSGRVTIPDVLLMFIYLEIWAMIAQEATTRKLPVNFIIYIAITALTRHLVGVAGDKATTDIGLLVDAGAILILAVAAVLLEFRSILKPSRPVSLPKTISARSDGEVRLAQH